MHNIGRLFFVLATAVAIFNLSFTSAEAKTYRTTCVEGKECKISVPFKVKKGKPETKEVQVLRPNAFDVTLSVGSFGYLTNPGGGTEHTVGGFDGRVVLNYSPWANNIFLRGFLGAGYGWSSHQVVGAPGTEKWERQGSVTSQEGLGVEWRGETGLFRLGGKHRTLWQMQGSGIANMLLATIGLGWNLSTNWSLVAELEVGWNFYPMEKVIWDDPLRTVGDPPRVEIRSLDAPVFGGTVELEYRF